jgi:shikimate dehydrogenase
MRKYGLIGYPLGHSFSKKYFTEKFRRERLDDCLYELFPIPDINLLPSLPEQEKDLCGLNVTIPYKSAVIHFLDFISPEAKEIGAVNVVKIKWEQDRVILSGYNSDATGFEKSLLPHLGSRRGEAIILGTGGSSRAVAYVLKKIGMNMIFVSRKRVKGKITYDELDRETIQKSTLIVNTTPLGMFPEIDSKPPLDYSALTKDQILYDLVYNPELTSFLREGQERGCHVINGLKMLHIQAERSWEIWNDVNL